MLEISEKDALRPSAGAVPISQAGSWAEQLSAACQHQAVWACPESPTEDEPCVLQAAAGTLQQVSGAQVDEV